MGLDMYLYGSRRVVGLQAGEKPHEYVSGYDFQPPEARERYQQLVAVAGLATVATPKSPGAFIDTEVSPPQVQVTVAYWRKANAIHQWFVEHVQGGVDECQLSPVTRAQLRELRDTAAFVLGSTTLEPAQVVNGYRVLSCPSHPDGFIRRPIVQEGQQLRDTRVAMEALPTQEGFFFGSTAYDEGYWDDLEETVRQIDAALTAPEDTEFFYQSSW